jgi:hypothetical protein
LAGFDSISRLDENADDFAGHGSDNLLPAFGFECAMTPTAPPAWIGNLGGELLQSSLELKHTVRRMSDANFVRLTFEKQREHVGLDFDRIGIDRLAIERDFPAFRMAFEFNAAQLFS